MESLVRAVNNHSEFYYEMFDSIEMTHTTCQSQIKIWNNKYYEYKKKLAMLDILEKYYTEKCWNSEKVDIYNTFLKAKTNCKIKMNRYRQQYIYVPD